MPSPGAAICTPTRSSPFGSRPTEKPRAGQPGFKARLLKGASFRLVAIRGVQQLVLQGGDFRGAFELCQLSCPRRDLSLEAALLLEAGERELERLLGRSLKAALASPVEVH